MQLRRSTGSENIVGNYDVKNGFYDISGDNEQRLQTAVDELAQSVHFDKTTKLIYPTIWDGSAVSAALVHIEKAKAFDFARVATRILMDDDRNKVIISVNYTSTITEIQNLLIFYDPLILNGKVTPKKRGIIIQQFNDNPEVRVLIMPTVIGCVGISLHDTRGDSPRWMLISPSYKLLEVVQLTARIYRNGVASNATVRMFYGKGSGTTEIEILTDMARKSSPPRDPLSTDNTHDWTLPINYESWFETS